MKQAQKARLFSLLKQFAVMVEYSGIKMVKLSWRNMIQEKISRREILWQGQLTVK
jgi:hypothetical protein